MRNKSADYNTDMSQGEQHYSPLKLSKQDFELFDEEKNVPAGIIRVKYSGSLDKNEKWRIFSNDTLVFTLDGKKISKRERQFLRGLDGINCLIYETKQGFKSFNELRLKIKKHLKTHKQ